MIGTTLLIPSMTLLLDAFPLPYHGTAIWILIVSTAFLTASAALALAEQCRRPKAQRHSTAKSDVQAALLETGSSQQAGAGTSEPAKCAALWPWMSVLFMLAGGVFFLAASCMYLPVFANTTIGGSSNIEGPWPPTGLLLVASSGGISVPGLGTWVFRAGTASYIWGGTISLMRIAQGPGGCANAKRATTGVVLYLFGAVMCFIGGALSQLQLPGFAATWLVGSFFFSAGSFAFVIPDIPCCAHCV